ncbi:zinc ribbon domain-containing protein [Zavarzinella formosa]|uniref:hypothetical protein n=1 Tax=Zavarzinella formosa TaxID=360055 RepID=UPI0012FBB7C9|nr:hypothetical protein [Zavarzinella formosa]
MIAITCPKCGAGRNVGDYLLGLAVVCKVCQTSIVVGRAVEEGPSVKPVVDNVQEPAPSLPVQNRPIVADVQEPIPSPPAQNRPIVADAQEPALSPPVQNRPVSRLSQWKPETPSPSPVVNPAGPVESQPVPVFRRSRPKPGFPVFFFCGMVLQVLIITAFWWIDNAEWEMSVAVRRDARLGVFWLACLLMLVNLFAFGLMLGKRNLQTCYQWFARCFVGVVAGLLLTVAGIVGIEIVESESQASAASQEVAQSVLILCGIVIAVAIVLFVFSVFGMAVAMHILLYKLWDQVQNGWQKATPGQAVGYLFIPFYNIYWIFVAFVGLADDLNHCAERRLLNVQLASRGLMMAHCVLMLLGGVPLIGLLASLLDIFVLFFALRSATQVAVALEQQI